MSGLRDEERSVGGCKSADARLNTFKMEMPVHPESRSYIHFFA